MNRPSLFQQNLCPCGASSAFYHLLSLQAAVIRVIGVARQNVQPMDTVVPNHTSSVYQIDLITMPKKSSATRIWPKNINNDFLLISRFSFLTKSSLLLSIFSRRSKYKGTVKLDLRYYSANVKCCTENASSVIANAQFIDTQLSISWQLRQAIQQNERSMTEMVQTENRSHLLRMIKPILAAIAKHMKTCKLKNAQSNTRSVLVCD